ncbi:MAG: glycosyltransferase family 4 protein [Candidatus Thorarchaeota archaeon]
MKICFLADANHPNTQNWVKYFANNLGHEVYLLTFEKSDKDLGKTKEIIIESIFKNTKFKYLVSIQKTKNILSKINPDILIGYRPTSYGFLAACTGFHPLVIALQGQTIVFPTNSKIKKLFSGFAIRKSDLINSWADHMSADIIKLGLNNKKKIKVFPRGVRIPKNKIEKKVSQDLVMVSTRGLVPGYRFDQIISALPLVAKNVDIFKYKISGDGKDRERLQTLVKKLGMEKYVEFLGKIEYELAMNLLKTSHIYVSAVPTDGVSASLLEAMAYGVFPVVTDNTPNRIWIEDGVNGFLFPHGDISALAEKITKAFVMKDLRMKAAEINYQIVKEKADWDQNMKKMETQYLELVERFNRAGIKNKNLDNIE